MIGHNHIIVGFIVYALLGMVNIGLVGLDIRSRAVDWLIVALVCWNMYISIMHASGLAAVAANDTSSGLFYISFLLAHPYSLA